GCTRRVAEPCAVLGEGGYARSPDRIAREASKAAGRELLEGLAGLVARAELAMQDREPRPPRRAQRPVLHELREHRRDFMQAPLLAADREHLDAEGARRMAAVEARAELARLYRELLGLVEAALVGGDHRHRGMPHRAAERLPHRVVDGQMKTSRL